MKPIRIIFPVVLCVMVAGSNSAKASDGTGADAVHSVCDVVKNIERLNGRTITVRGLIGWTGRHGISALAQEGLDAYVQTCPGSDKRKRSWPPVLHVESPDTLGPENGTVTFYAELPNLHHLAETIRRYKGKTSESVVIATITGEVKARKNLKIVRRGDDIIGNGYGQVGACPGLLVVKRVIAAEDPETHAPVSLLVTANTPGEGSEH